MPGPGDPPWEDEFAEDTKLDQRQALPEESVPAAVSPRDVTGKYKTLSGYGVSSDVQTELAFGRGCAHCTKKVLMALKLAQMASGTHPTIAQAQVEKLRAWMNDPQNAELIRVAMADED